MHVAIKPVTPDIPSAYLKPLADVLDRANGKSTTLRAGIAYATYSGTRLLITQCESKPEWSSLRKLFLVGLHHGITEPSALSGLRSLPNAEVRVVVPGGRLSLDALYSSRIYHPKVFAVCEDRSNTIAFLQAGSANLTAAAIGDAPTNHELGVAIYGRNGKSVDRSGQFMPWWEAAWTLGRVADTTVIRRYAELRKKMLEQNPLLRGAIATPNEIEFATTLFIEVGAGSGPPHARHQVEFPESIVRYFGKPRQGRRDLTLIAGNKSWRNRPLSFKQTTFGVAIWRLGMPTQTTGGDPVAQRVIRFERTAKRWQFRYRVLDVNGREHRQCIADANLHGHLGSTGGPSGRQFGFFG